MPRITEGPAVAALVAFVVPLLFASPTVAFDHLMVTEYAFTPSSGEFIEIFNPTGSVVVLDDYFVTDMVFQPDSLDSDACYWHLADGGLAANDFDFIAQFPPGNAIAPGQTIVISINDAQGFTGFWSEVPDFELPKAGNGGTVPQMLDAGVVHMNGAQRVGNSAGLSNGSEIVILFRWDGESPLVEDVDLVQWGNGPPEATTGPDKTNVTIVTESGTASYLPDTPKSNQQAVVPHGFRFTSQRVDFREGSEVQSGGNGPTGHDETSEDLPDTWLASGPATIGGTGAFGPPGLLGAGPLTEQTLALTFSRELEEDTATDITKYRLLRILTPAGTPVEVRVPLNDATAADGGTTILFDTGIMQAGALHEITVLEQLPSEDGLGSVIPGSRVRFYGFQPGPEIALTVPRRPFVPHLDQYVEIGYTVPQGAGVRLRVYDFQGRLMLERTERAPTGGQRSFLWDGRDRLNQRLPAGVYYMQLESGGGSTVQPIVIGSAAEGVR